MVLGTDGEGELGSDWTALEVAGGRILCACWDSSGVVGTLKVPLCESLFRESCSFEGTLNSGDDPLVWGWVNAVLGRWPELEAKIVDQEVLIGIASTGFLYACFAAGAGCNERWLFLSRAGGGLRKLEVGTSRLGFPVCCVSDGEASSVKQNLGTTPEFSSSW